MSAKKEPGVRDDLDEMERSYWEVVKGSRAKEDLRIDHEYTTQEAQLRHQLVDLYDRKTQLNNELRLVAGRIQQYEEQQERLAHDFEKSRERLRAQRREDDRTQEDRFAKKRETLGSTRPKSSGSTGRRQSGSQSGAAGWTSINGASRRRSRREEDEVEPPADPGNLLSSIYHNPVDETEPVGGRAMPLRSSATRARAGPVLNGLGIDVDMNGPDGPLNSRVKDRLLKPKRHSLPSIPAGARLPVVRASGPELYNESKAKSPSGRKSLPSAKGSVSLTESPAPTNDGQEITRDKLTFRDDGRVMLEPPMFAGVPLERIDASHPYWDPEWEPLESIIQPQLDKWKEKLEQLRQTPDAIRHTVFLANRQVNRGQSVIDFLREETWHPYQFVCKDMMTKCYKTFINYDTIFRLCNVHEELKKFDLDVKPLEWLRVRMLEVAAVQGEKFSLSKTVHDLYHDAKLKFLREKHGFGNIGRPSGYKLAGRDPAKGVAKAKVKQEPAALGRRKPRRSIGQVDAEDTPSLDGIQRGSEQPQLEVFEPVTPRSLKRQRLEPAPPKEEPPEDDDLDYNGWTSTDSFSAGRIMHLDWRVYQIKTRSLTTSIEVTQYWTWKPEKNLFEHQVLRDVFPKVTWGFYQKPINFNLGLEEVREIQYAPECQKILVIIADEKRGNILTHFKRERTKKRFLAFAKKKGLKLVKRTGAQLEEVWEKMESETMPNGESDA
ncbi:hypothetical protein GGS23DRAFT_393728 [Durotheca rogersii]|uniref:uncharacterized protein n=1 Tax=Durotheca rogersii TaxID=419775 RepID=UPI0022204A27|nr:uncharacterized protein GGS23DRAFT_393728 [Durotheca rogersii]KAI5856788.1 hypothetical protein GGS23DRAFT_393728 [Durotheca rogersii]